jgi:NTP pyrophosphatase (non-canonical NTP hydrolase)
MNLNEYQELAGRTDTQDGNTIYHALGLVSESGEYAGVISKVIRDNKGVWNTESNHKAVKELGDVLWFVARSAKALGYTLDEVAQINLHKLASRAERNVISGSGDDR